MTVKELIEKLNTFPLDSKVIRFDYDYGFQYIELSDVVLVHWRDRLVVKIN